MKGASKKSCSSQVWYILPFNLGKNCFFELKLPVKVCCMKFSRSTKNQLKHFLDHRNPSNSRNLLDQLLAHFNLILTTF